MSARTPGPALVRVSISATDEEWELVGERANRQRMSGSRYLVAAALSEGGAHPVAGGDERDLLEAVRRLRPLLSGGAGGLSGYGMRERLAVLFAAWAGGLAAAGRGAELRAVLAPALGDEGAGRIAAAFAPASPARTTASNGPEDRTGGPESWQPDGGHVETGDAGPRSPPLADESSKPAETVETGADPKPPDQGALF